jgi:hypothetical protein
MVLAIVGAVSVVMAATILISGTFKYGPVGGSLSPYVVGVYDTDEGEVDVSITNPTPYDLFAILVQYDDDQEPVACARFHLSPNDLAEYEIRGDCPEEGVIKIVSTKPYNPGQSIWVQSGVVAWTRVAYPLFTCQAGFLATQTGCTLNLNSIADTELVSLPGDLLTANSSYELQRIINYADQNCSEVAEGDKASSLPL